MPRKCSCVCLPEKHGLNGCRTWYGDKNTGFSCECDWQGPKYEPTHQRTITIYSHQRPDKRWKAETDEHSAFGETREEAEGRVLLKFSLTLRGDM